MRTITLAAATLSFYAIAAIAPASAASLSEQTDLCQAEITTIADTAFSRPVEITFRASNGSTSKKKRLTFTVRDNDDWGIARCTIVGEDIETIRWPRAFQTKIAIASHEPRTVEIADRDTATN